MFLMNVYDANGRATGRTVETKVHYYDERTQLRVVECDEIYYVCDCEGDAQCRGMNVGVALHNVRHAMIVFEFIAMEGEYY